MMMLPADRMTFSQCLVLSRCNILAIITVQMTWLDNGALVGGQLFGSSFHIADFFQSKTNGVLTYKRESEMFPCFHTKTASVVLRPQGYHRSLIVDIQNDLSHYDCVSVISTKDTSTSFR